MKPWEWNSMDGYGEGRGGARRRHGRREVNGRTRDFLQEGTAMAKAKQEWR